MEGKEQQKTGNTKRNKAEKHKREQTEEEYENITEK